MNTSIWSESAVGAVALFILGCCGHGVFNMTAEDCQPVSYGLVYDEDSATVALVPQFGMVHIT